MNLSFPEKKLLNRHYFLHVLRMQYYNWIIYEKFVPLTKTGNDEELVACREMATEIIFSLLDHWTRFGCTLMYT